MKNATSKHHTIEASEGINDGKYALQYTTCPDKSYVVKPDDGKINYNEFKDSKAHQFVEKIINGKVERIEIVEQNSPAKRNSINIKSPVKISKEHCARSSMVRFSRYIMTSF